MIRQRTENLAATLAAVTIFLLAAVIYLTATTDNTPPVVAFTNTEVLNAEPVTPGGILRVRIFREKLRDDCPVTSLRSAVALGDGMAGRSFNLPDAIASAGGPPGREFVDQGYPIPAWLEPGDYLLRVHLIYDCSGLIFHYDQPDTPFTVERAPMP
jgi:hypothetical protein